MNVDSIILMINQFLGTFLHQGSSDLASALLNFGMI